jgi:hypothetical protein
MRNDPNLIVVHCTATPPDLDIGAEEIDAMHRRKGWNGIGYHSVVRLDGSEELGRDPDGDGNATEHVGAHAYGYNTGSVAIVYVGGIDSSNRPADTRTPEQRTKLFEVVERWQAQFGIPVDRVSGHYELNPEKACPSFPMGPFREALIARAVHSVPIQTSRPDASAARIAEMPDRLPLLRQGHFGQMVAAAQALLRANGYSLAITGSFDTATDRAVRMLQHEHRLSADGVIGWKETWPALILGGAGNAR